MPNLLVVDDEQDTLDYLSDELKGQGYQVTCAQDGVEGVLKAADPDWNAVLMDIRLPKLDGLGALRIIHRLKPDLPVILFTGHAGQQEILLSTSLGAYTCLIKPIHTEILFKTLKEVI